MKFQISYPVDVFMISQGFGANPAMYADPKYGGIKGHNGLDLFAGHGNPVYATHDGLAHFEIDPSGGHGVVILSNDEFEYKNGTCQFKTIYWHLCDGIKEPEFKSPLEGVGPRQVKNGDLIGYADNTGASTGDHLHFGLKPVKNGVNIESDNGYLGAIDPFLYFDGYRPKDILNFTSIVETLKAKVIELRKKLGLS